MKFTPKKHIKSTLVGLISEQGKETIRVYAYPDTHIFYCEFQGERINAPDVDSLVRIVATEAHETLIWHDVIHINHFLYGTEEHLEFTLDHTRMHMARKTDGRWVCSPWHPELSDADRKRVKLVMPVTLSLTSTDLFPLLSGEADYYLEYTEEKWNKLTKYREDVEFNKITLHKEMLK